MVETSPPSGYAEKIHEACRYLCGFDVAGWDGHMRNDEIAGVISGALSGLVEQLEIAQELVEEAYRFALVLAELKVTTRPFAEAWLERYRAYEGGRFG